MGDHIYFALRNISWECIKCWLPNFSSSTFDMTLFATTTNQFEPLSSDAVTKTSELEFSFNSPQATSSPNKPHYSTRTRNQNVVASPCSTTADTDKPLMHPSFLSDTDEPQSIHTSKKQHKDMPFKVINAVRGSCTLQNKFVFCKEFVSGSNL